MYTINQKNGIGEVISQDETLYTVYFEETDRTSKLLKSLTTTYDSIEAAELALNPEMTEDEAVAHIAAIEAEKEIMRAGAAAQARLEEINIEASKKLMRNI